MTYPKTKANTLMLVAKSIEIQSLIELPPYLSVQAPSLEDFEWRQDATVYALMDACGLKPADVEMQDADHS